MRGGKDFLNWTQKALTKNEIKIDELDFIITKNIYMFLKVQIT